MTTFTDISEIQLKGLLENYALGEYQQYFAIEEGVTNSNYHVITDLGNYIFTIFETLEASHLGFYLDLMNHLAERQFPCPRPLADQRDEYLHTHQEKPCAFIQCLPGEAKAQLSAQDSQIIGHLLADLHRKAQDFPRLQPNAMGLDWMQATAKVVMPKLSPEAVTLLGEELDYQLQQDYTRLPKGIIHADLFRDNVLFAEDNISGVIDFYYACHDYLLLDIATVMNDWCLNDKQQLDPRKQLIFLMAYQHHRRLTGNEIEKLPDMLRLSALRFWLSRLKDFHFPHKNNPLAPKDPLVFETLLQQHRQAESIAKDV